MVIANKYSQLEDWELEREVLTRLGWTLRTDAYNWFLVNPEGKDRWREPIEGIPKPDDFWYRHYDVQGNHTQELDMAWSLPLAIGCKHRLEQREGHDTEAFIYKTKSGNEYTIGYTNNSNAARALCEAWLLFMDYQEE